MQKFILFHTHIFYSNIIGLYKILGEFIFVFICLKNIIYFKRKYFDSDRIIEILIFNANIAFNNLIKEKFNKAKFNFIPKRRMDINDNNLILFNG